MNLTIYYFSGTGNSLAVARDLAEKLSGELVPIAKLSDMERISSPSDYLGIVFPLYDFKPPKIVEDFIHKIENLESKYIFAVCTYGITPLKAMKYLDKLIRMCGGKLSGGFAVEMPHNGIGSSLFSQSRHKMMFENWKKKCNTIFEYVTAWKEGTLEKSNAFVSLILSGLFIRMIPTLFKLLKLVLLKGWKSLALNANEKCIGCENCKKICPVRNIEIIEHKPYWKDHCAGCLACMHWCPNEAIQISNINMNTKNYHHPDVKLADMIIQNKE
jgi:formate hydrogenlyase subunit 6/NADH:ubiquinone oxidoreductase subunit I/flavodoxin